MPCFGGPATPSNGAGLLEARLWPGGWLVRGAECLRDRTIGCTKRSGPPDLRVTQWTRPSASGHAVLSPAKVIKHPRESAQHLAGILPGWPRCAYSALWPVAAQPPAAMPPPTCVGCLGSAVRRPPAPPRVSRLSPITSRLNTHASCHQAALRSACTLAGRGTSPPAPRLYLCPSREPHLAARSRPRPVRTRPA